MTYLECTCAHLPFDMRVYCQCFCNCVIFSGGWHHGTTPDGSSDSSCGYWGWGRNGTPDFRNVFLEFFGRQPQHQLHLQFRTEVAIFEFGGWLQSFSWTVFGSDCSAKPFNPKLAKRVDVNFFRSLCRPAHKRFPVLIALQFSPAAFGYRCCRTGSPRSEDVFHWAAGMLLSPLVEGLGGFHILKGDRDGNAAMHCTTFLGSAADFLKSRGADPLHLNLSFFCSWGLCQGMRVTGVTKSFDCRRHINKALAI